MAEDPSVRDNELNALRLGLDLGLTLVDTAEMYGDGDAEELVGEAIEEGRDEVFLVSRSTVPSRRRRGHNRSRRSDRLAGDLPRGPC